MGWGVPLSSQNSSIHWHFPLSFMPPCSLIKQWHWTQTPPHHRNGSHLTFPWFWNAAFQTACYLINHLPTPLLKNSSPYEKLFHTTPDYSLSLGVLVGQTYELIIPTNSNLTLFSVSFLAIASFTWVTSVFTFPMVALTFTVEIKSKTTTDSTQSLSCLPFLSVQPMVSSSGPHATDPPQARSLASPNPISP